uniref:alpha-1,2-Mannosidase n=1 Tax=Ascaris lumbricoides TaxID=6252 RepID=A0A0M3HNX3_ASCLU
MAFRHREKCIIIVGLVFISAIIVVSMHYLPNSDDLNIRSLQIVRDIANRRMVQSFDREILRAKIREANIPPPPLQPARLADTDDASTASQHGGAEAELARRRDFVKQMTKFAWDSYEKYAWGMNELRPLSRTGHSASIFGSGEIGATIVDALDTLYLMGLREEYERARKWIALSLNLRNSKGDISVFETNIRFIGGLLSAYALTNDTMFVDKALEIAELLLPAFETPTGIPYAMFNAQTGTARNWAWASGGCSILSEFGSLHLEFEYLSRITNRTIFYDKVARIREVLSSVEKPEGLYPNYLNPKTEHVSIGALGDSFYEYLLKSWILSSKRDNDAKRLYDDAIAAIEKHLLHFSKQSKLAYFAELKGSRVEHKMDHLACFIGGLFALQSMNEDSSEQRDKALDLAKQIGNTCHESYIRSVTPRRCRDETGTDTIDKLTATFLNANTVIGHSRVYSLMLSAIGIGPESFRFTSDVEAVAVSDREKYYIQRPEVIETWFYLWRATHDEKYRDWCWSAAQAIQKYCRTASGYSGIRNVYTTNVELDDVQQSFLFAETFKYLFLVFSEDDVLPLGKWVFNTEAHPFPVASSL